jgi:diguanylate cyclase (GGDEF)-like protein
MVTSVHSSTNAFEFKESSLRARLPLNNDEQNEARLKLTHVLQTTLNIEQVFELFFKHIQHSVPMSGLRYENVNHHCALQVGRDTPHHCDYRLITPDDDLGNIVFSRGKRFSEHEMATLESLLGTLIYPLRNALQYRQALQTAMNDPLTGAGNRVAMDNALHRELQMAQRYDQALSILMIDIDHFKQVNDNYGHAFGDSVLKEVVGAIDSVTRNTDMTFRYGGEEFVVVLSKTEAQGARVIGERIREYIEAMQVDEDGKKLQVSVSIGTSTLETNEPVKSLFGRADQALYKAKNNGRNRLEAALPAKAPAGNLPA